LFEAGSLTAAAAFLRTFRPYIASAAESPPGPKRILAVAVGNARRQYLDVKQNKPAPEVRQIVRAFTEDLNTRLPLTDPPPAFAAAPVDFIVAPPEALTEAITAYWRRSAPDLILTVASAPTRSARDARSSIERTTPRTPIVFTVVSQPVDEKFLQDETKPDQRITGVSSSLAHIAGKGARRFYDKLKPTNPPFTIYCLFRDGGIHSRTARKKVEDEHLPNMTVIEVGTWEEAVKKIQDPSAIPPNQKAAPKQSGIFILPDETLYANRAAIIRAAHDPARLVPVFVQDPDVVNEGGNPAYGAYGLSGTTIGAVAAEYAYLILRDPAMANVLPVLRLAQYDEKYSNAAAARLGLPPTPPQPPTGAKKKP
jgi:hypothetical protein